VVRRHVELSVRQNSQLVLNSFRNQQPVQTDDSISYVFASQSGRRIQNRLVADMLASKIA